MTQAIAENLKKRYIFVLLTNPVKVLRQTMQSCSMSLVAVLSFIKFESIHYSRGHIVSLMQLIMRFSSYYYLVLEIVIKKRFP